MMDSAMKSQSVPFNIKLNITQILISTCCEIFNNYTSQLYLSTLPCWSGSFPFLGLSLNFKDNNN